MDLLSGPPQPLVGPGLRGSVSGGRRCVTFRGKERQRCPHTAEHRQVRVVLEVRADVAVALGPGGSPRRSPGDWRLRASRHPTRGDRRRPSTPPASFPHPTRRSLYGAPSRLTPRRQHDRSASLALVPRADPKQMTALVPSISRPRGLGRCGPLASSRGEDVPVSGQWFAPRRETPMGTHAQPQTIGQSLELDRFTWRFGQSSAETTR